MGTGGGRKPSAALPEAWRGEGMGAGRRSSEGRSGRRSGRAGSEPPGAWGGRSCEESGRKRLKPAIMGFHSRVRADDKDGAAHIQGSQSPSPGPIRRSRLDDGRGNPPRSRSHAAQLLGEGRAGARTHGRGGIGPPRVGRRDFARGYSLDDRRRVERIANAAPAHGAESCRGWRPASNAALFDICACPAGYA